MSDERHEVEVYPPAQEDDGIVRLHTPEQAASFEGLEVHEPEKFRAVQFRIDDNDAVPELNGALFQSWRDFVRALRRIQLHRPLPDGQDCWPVQATILFDNDEDYVYRECLKPQRKLDPARDIREWNEFLAGLARPDDMSQEEYEAFVSRYNLSEQIEADIWANFYDWTGQEPAQL
jgi:hypothetical protein